MWIVTEVNIIGDGAAAAGAAATCDWAVLFIVDAVRITAYAQMYTNFYK